MDVLPGHHPVQELLIHLYNKKKEKKKRKKIKFELFIGKTNWTSVPNAPLARSWSRGND